MRRLFSGRVGRLIHRYFFLKHLSAGISENLNRTHRAGLERQ